jgi:hypothetical protein
MSGEPMTADEVRQRRGAALRTLDIANHRSTGPECPHGPSASAGAQWRAMPAVWCDPEGVHRETTVGALLCPLCAVLFDQTGGRP